MNLRMDMAGDLSAAGKFLEGGIYQLRSVQPPPKRA